MSNSCQCPGSCNMSDMLWCVTWSVPTTSPGVDSYFSLLRRQKEH
jgi:hypothetical protein